MYTEIDELEEQLRLAAEMQFISQLDLRPFKAVIHFSPHVTYKKIHELVRYINLKYKKVAWVPGSLYLVNPNKRITIHYKRDHS
jgi:hypothetical protein